MDAVLASLPFWELLTETEQGQVRSASVIRRYRAGLVLHGNCDGGASCLGLILVLSGRLCAYIISPEGREVTLFRLCEGDSCVLSASCILSQIDFDTMLTVDEEAELLVVPAPVYALLLDSNLRLRCFTYELAARHCSTVMHVLQQILFSRFDARLAGFLLQAAGEDGTLRMTQEQLARNVNSAREVVSRTLKQFSAAGLIENRRGLIRIRDAAGLEKLVE